MTKHGSCAVEIDGGVATIRIVPPRLTGGADLHWELGSVLDELRSDTATRVIVLTGTDEEFYVLPSPATFSDPASWARRVDPAGAWKTFTGILRVQHLMTEIEKPIVARVNGDAEAFGCSLVFASDLIVAAEEARLIDIHLGMGEHEHGPPFGLVAGDGGAPLVPLYMSPAKAKEFLMLSTALTGRELADSGIINAAVRRGELDAAVDDMVARLLRRSAFALAWTKRSANRRVADALNRSLDASVAYEMVDFLQLARLGHDPMTLD
jgi:enoyl-CoA hydratase/carnithine racemase